MDVSKILISKKYSELVPKTSDEDDVVLKESLLVYGQREPIIINQKNILLDGHRRFGFLSDRLLEVDVIKKHFENKLDEMMYVIQCNLHRRQLNNFQKVELTYHMYDVVKKSMKRGGDTRNKINSGGATAIIGRSIGINRNLVQRGVWLLENASGSLLTQLRSGSMSISRAYEISTNVNLSGRYLKIKEREIFKTQPRFCPHCNNEVTFNQLLLKN